MPFPPPQESVEDDDPETPFTSGLSGSRLRDDAALEALIQEEEDAVDLDTSFYDIVEPDPHRVGIQDVLILSPEEELRRQRPVAPEPPRPDPPSTWERLTGDDPFDTREAKK